MANYYLYTEFHEYHKQQRCLGIKVGKPIPTIDLISIGIVSKETEYEGIYDDKNIENETEISKSDTSREYYAISKDFNIEDAWNSYQMETDRKGTRANYWLRENVLKPIFFELSFKDNWLSEDKSVARNMFLSEPALNENFKWFKILINKYGKTNKQIAEEIKSFIFKDTYISCKTGKRNINSLNVPLDIQFYAYYADYDWVVLAQLFGKMIDLPKGFPMYCNDLKQEIVRIENKANKHILDMTTTPQYRLKSLSAYPKQDNEHNALDDAIFCKKLHNFIKTLEV